MTPKEWLFVQEVIVATAKAAYALREKERNEGKDFNPNQFVLGKVSVLTLKNQLARFLKGK